MPTMREKKIQEARDVLNLILPNLIQAAAHFGDAIKMAREDRSFENSQIACIERLIAVVQECDNRGML